MGGYWSCKGVHNIPPSCSPFHSQRVNQVREGVTPGFGDPSRSHRAVTVSASVSPGSLEAAKVGDAGGMQPALLVPPGSPLWVLHPCLHPAPRAVLRCLLVGVAAPGAGLAWVTSGLAPLPGPMGCVQVWMGAGIWCWAPAWTGLCWESWSCGAGSCRSSRPPPCQVWGVNARLAASVPSLGSCP